ncbi:Retaining alpha-galactosidase precursor [Lacunisphaera limnophila]|uniref:Retaining alpha-galactosidase n=1 Tax=Lacunisphaera limnophila TaxID=1838286 RepID=A0A1D8ATN0_9BACT|nr:glycoside hydrolase family 97 protein [Lacunisphaera limnophila]AOS44232.1 Retaining alpha-galactosidase precursor [Lacunisphaera limnophila]
MKTRLLLAPLALLLAQVLPAQAIKSPDGALAVQLTLDGGALTYQVSRDGRLMLEPSPLGLETSLGSFATGLKAAGVTTAQIDERYTLPHGKVRDVHYVANELTARFTNATGDSLEVIFRVSDRDVAFAYRLSGKDRQRVTIQREATGFNFPAAATAFVTWQAKPGDGWMKSKPSYEEGYQIDEPVGTKSPTGLGFTFPALFRVGDNGWVLVSETGTTSHYAGTRLGDPTPDGIYPIAFPEPGENGGIGDATVSAAMPLLTPWRTLTVGATLAPIVESTVATDVVQPLYAPSQVYAPGRATWSWLVWQDASMNEADQRTFIDLAATMGWEYILVDALWEGNLGRAKLAELVTYARSKKVEVLLWYNSNGAWNDAPQDPRNRMDSAPARQQEMAWLKSIGVKGLKVDFFGGDKQTTMKLYEDILTDGNAHGLMLVFHGTTIPRGWERMYPNFLSSEAATVSENLIFSQGFADGEARLSTILSHLRNPVAPLDFGPMVLNRTFHKEAGKGNQRRTTDAFQLATTVLYQSPLQHFGLTPNNLKEQPAFVLDFLRSVPVVWDETRYLAGYPGKHVALARRHGNRWFVAATNGEKQAKELTLSVPFLAGRTLTLIHDGPAQTAATRPVTVGADGQLTLTLEVGGGAVLFE